jgi:hypothetical protein
MSLTDIAALGSIVSSAAVALSLFYVALQVRQAEKNQRGLMQQGRADRVGNASLAISLPETASVWIKGAQLPEMLSAEEMERFLLLCRAAFISGEDSFLQHRAGLLDEAAFRSYVAGLKGQLTGSRGLRAAWRILSNQFGADFSGFVDGVLAQISPQPAPDRMAMWRELLREEAERPAQPVGR